jgi:hypothetical protein
LRPNRTLYGSASVVSPRERPDILHQTRSRRIARQVSLGAAMSTENPLSISPYGGPLKNNI